MPKPFPSVVVLNVCHRWMRSRDQKRKSDYAPPCQEGECVVKFLIDECLSLDLVAVACDRGFVESSHVVWMGKSGWKDWELKPFILRESGRLLPEIASTFGDLLMIQAAEGNCER